MVRTWHLCKLRYLSVSGKKFHPPSSQGKRGWKGTLNFAEKLLDFHPHPQYSAAVPLTAELMQGLLEGQPDRIAHSHRVAQLADQIATELEGTPDEIQSAWLAALFHDVGYSPTLRITGFHPLDGAVFLAHQGAPEAVLKAVALHGFARKRMADFPGIASLYASLPENEGCPLVELVGFCDLRVSHEGELVTLPERIHGILTRYGPEHPTHRRTLEEIPASRQLQAAMLKRLQQKAPNRLPWVFLDVDHTLMEPGEDLSCFSRKILEEYREQGGRISLATGKHPLAIQGLASRLRLAGPHIAGNGCVVFRDSETKQLASLGPVSWEIALYLEGMGIPYISYSLQGLFGLPALIGEPHFRAFRELQEPRPILREPDCRQPVFKVLTFLDAREVEKEEHLRAAAKGWGVEPVRTSSRFLEFVPLHSGKGAAVREVLSQARWPQFHSLAIGDSENDLSMFRVAGRSGAMGNAVEEVSRSADLLTTDCREDGVARILESILRAGEANLPRLC